MKKEIFTMTNYKGMLDEMLSRDEKRLTHKKLLYPRVLAALCGATRENPLTARQLADFINENWPNVETTSRQVAKAIQAWNCYCSGTHSMIKYGEDVEIMVEVGENTFKKCYIYTYYLAEKDA